MFNCQTVPFVSAGYKFQQDGVELWCLIVTEKQRYLLLLVTEKITTFNIWWHFVKEEILKCSDNDIQQKDIHPSTVDGLVAVLLYS